MGRRKNIARKARERVLEQRDEYLMGILGPLHEARLLQGDFTTVAAINHSDSEDDVKSSPSEQDDDSKIIISSKSTPSIPAGSQGLMRCFWDLASFDPAVRIRAGGTVIAILKKSQTALPDMELSPDTEYTLKRLIRGMGSNRKAARQGFGVVLCEVLATFPKHVVSMIETIHKLSGSMTSREKREAQYGRLFSYAAIVQSGSLAKKEAGLLVGEIVAKLLEIAAFKVYTNPSSILTLCSLIKQIPFETFQKHVFGQIQTTILPTTSESKDAMDVLSVQGACLLLAADTHLRTLVAKKKHGLSSSVRSQLSRRMPVLNFELPATNLLEISMLQAQIMHPFWVLLADALAKLSMVTFSLTWERLIENTLLHEDNVTDDRQAILLVLIRMVAQTNVTKIKAMLTPSVMRLLMMCLTSNIKLLTATARSVLASLVASVNGHSSSAVRSASRLHLLARLTGPHGSRRFDQVTKTSTISNILGSLSIDEVRPHLTQLQKEFSKPFVASTQDVCENDADKDSIIASHQNFILDQILALCRNPKVPKDESWPFGCLLFYLLHGYFDIAHHEDIVKEILQGVCDNCIIESTRVPLTEETKMSCRSHFTTLLSILSSAPPFGENVKGSNGCRPDGSFRISHIVSIIERLIAHVPTWEPAGSDVKSAFGELVQLRHELEECSSSGSASNHATRSLLYIVLHTIPAVLTDHSHLLKTTPDLVNASQDLKDRVFGVNECGPDSVDPIEVVVDILLGMTSHSSALLRGIVDRAFAMLCDNMTTKAVELIASVISDAKPMHEISEDEEDGSDLDEHSDHDHELAEHDDDDEDVESISESDEEDDGFNPDGDQNLRALRSKVGTTLQIPVDSDGNFVGDTASDHNEDGGESDWDDDKMAAVDDILAAHFREHVHRKKSVNKADRIENTRFKLRVLDLVDIYFRRKSADANMVILLPALLQTLKTCRSLKKEGIPLIERVTKLITCRLPQLKPVPSIDTKHASDVAHAALEQAVEVSVNSHDARHRLIGNATCRFLLRILTRGVGEITTLSEITGKDKRVIGKLHCSVFESLYADAVRKFLTKKTCDMDEKHLISLVQPFPTLAWLLVPVFARFISTCCKLPRCKTAMTYITSLFQQKKYLQQNDGVLMKYGKHIVRFFEGANLILSRDGVRAKLVRFYLNALLLAVRALKGHCDISSLRTVVEHHATNPLALETPLVVRACKSVITAIDDVQSEHDSSPKISQDLKINQKNNSSQNKDTNKSGQGTMDIPLPKRPKKTSTKRKQKR